MAVWRKFKEKGKAMVGLMKRGCWMKCYGCEDEWKNIETEYVHMILFQEDGKQLTRFCCDDCVNDFDKKK